MIEDVDELSHWMQSQYAKKLKEDQVVITHIRQASSGVIAMASESGAQVQLSQLSPHWLGPTQLA